MLIGELARQAGTSARTLRYYEAHGLLLAERAANGYRVYADDDAVRRQLQAQLACAIDTEVAR